MIAKIGGGWIARFDRIGTAILRDERGHVGAAPKQLLNQKDESGDRAAVGERALTQSCDESGEIAFG